MNPEKNLIIVSSDIEWKIARALYPDSRVDHTPFGEMFTTDVVKDSERCSVAFFQGGWGKIAAAASTQYVIDHFSPSLIINIGTCGGFGADVQKGDVLLANKTVVYDIVERMGDPDEAIDAYTTAIDNARFEPLPQGIKQGTMLSADADVDPLKIDFLAKKYHAAVADWESGAIAWVAARNTMPLLILRGVSDIVSPSEALAYSDSSYFEESTRQIMANLIEKLPDLIAIWSQNS